MPVDLNVVLLTALLNPVAIAVAFWRGRSAEAGIFIAQLVLGLVWAAAGYRCARRSP